MENCGAGRCSGIGHEAVSERAARAPTHSRRGLPPAPSYLREAFRPLGTMHLFALTLQKASSITAAVFGNFSEPRKQELIIARGGRVLELACPDENGTVQTIHAADTFGMIRSLATCRLTGGNRDYIVLGTDSGKIVILEYSKDKQCFERVHAETYGKTGLRRIVPGQYVATDPRGRAVMVGALEKQKLVYILNRDGAARLTISSPLEAHKSSTLCFDLIGVDVGFDNPIFAALEVDMEEVENELDTKEVSAPAPTRHPSLSQPNLTHPPLSHVQTGALREIARLLRARSRPQSRRSQMV